MKYFVFNFTITISCLLSVNMLPKEALFKYHLFADAYYTYDVKNPNSLEKENFISNHKLNNTPDFNLLMASAEYNATRFRSHLGVVYGNYQINNLKTEPIFTKHIMEANIGFKLLSNHQLWLDVGVMPSHIGFEYPISETCWTLTRSILADNSPYFESGLKLSYTSNNNKLYYAFLVLNGWQKITIDNKSKPAFGAQITYKENENITFNYSNYIDYNLTATQGGIFIYNNLYVQIDGWNKFGIVVGLDVARDFSSTNHPIFAPVFIAKYNFNSKYKLTARLEHYDDVSNVIIHNVKGFNLNGISTNFDVQFNKYFLLRFEAKFYQYTSTQTNLSSFNNRLLTMGLTYRL